VSASIVSYRFVNLYTNSFLDTKFFGCNGDGATFPAAKVAKYIAFFQLGKIEYLPDDIIGKRNPLSSEYRLWQR
jgi:hypothetical protein